jgi:hypothetical protein
LEGQPGQAIIFVERLVHATVPWRAASCVEYSGLLSMAFVEIRGGFSALHR